MNHLTWPDAFAVTALVAGFVVFFYFLFRATGRGDFDLGSSLHRERMSELKERHRSRRPLPDFATTTTTTAVDLRITGTQWCDALVAAGVLVKNEDGSYAPAAVKVEPAPLVTPPPKESPDAVP